MAVPPPARFSPSNPDSDRAEIELQIARILASAQFRTSRRRCELLQWAAGRVLAGNMEPAKEYHIAQEVFGKPDSWDPRYDSSVRVEFNRMRQKLREYYESEGAHDPILIEFPFRGYLPSFKKNGAGAAAPEGQNAGDHEAVPPRAAHRSVRLPLMASTAVLVLAVLGFGAFSRSHKQPAITTLAVLPFMDLTNDGQHAYLSDGFTEELTNSLATIKGLGVISRTSAFQFKGKSVDVREIGQKLGAGAVVEGSILGQGDRIRVIVQLNRTSDGTHLWQAQYDRDAKDILGVEDEIAQAVAGALRVRLIGPVTAAYVPSSEAFIEYLKGFAEEQKSTPASFALAEQHYQDAIRLAPRYAWPHARLASVHLARAGRSGPKQNTELENARREAEVAISLDPRLPMPRAQLSFVNYVLNWDWPSAEEGFRSAINAGYSATAHQTYAWALMTRGRFAEAEQQSRQAMQLDPLNCQTHINLSLLLHMSGRAAGALQELDECLKQNPKWFPGLLQRGYFEIYDNHPAEGLTDIQRAALLVPGSPMFDQGLAIAYVESGRRAQALALFHQMESQADAKGYTRYALALVSAYLGDRDRLFHWLEQSVELHEQQALNMRIDPSLAAFQQDARMIELQKRIGLI